MLVPEVQKTVEALRDASAMEGIHDVYSVFMREIEDLFPNMLRVVVNLDGKDDDSHKAIAKDYTADLRTAVKKYMPAYQPDGMPHYMLKHVFPKCLCGTVAKVDILWRTVLGVVDNAAPDDVKEEATEMLRGILEKGAEMLYTEYKDAADSAPDKRRIREVRSAERYWKHMQDEGLDEHVAYEKIVEMFNNKAKQKEEDGKQHKDTNGD
jgi:hypothetical protein